MISNRKSRGAVIGESAAQRAVEGPSCWGGASGNVQLFRMDRKRRSQVNALPSTDHRQSGRQRQCALSDPAHVCAAA